MSIIASRNWVKSLLNKMNIGKYSTDEVKVGTWIDGKTIYRKYVYVNNVVITNSGRTINYDIDVAMPISAKAYHSAGICSDLYWANNNKIFYCAEGITAEFLILEYTKTTD